MRRRTQDENDVKALRGIQLVRVGVDCECFGRIDMSDVLEVSISGLGKMIGLYQRTA